MRVRIFTCLHKSITAASFPSLLWSTFLIILAGLVVFSQTWAFYGDEGFHLLASRLIILGKKPYLDFFYPQMPLFAYLSAAWMQIFSDTWRSSHMLSALLTGGSVVLSSAFLFERLPETGWKLSAAVIAAILMGFNTMVLGFGTIGQAYGVCLFLIVLCFWLVIKAVAESRSTLLLWSGLCAGASAGSSLLSAPVLPILLAWAASRVGNGRRVKTCLWFLAGVGISCLPLIWLAVLAPRQTIFNILEYHILYRSPNTLTAMRVNIRTLAEILNSAQFTLPILFAGIGLLFVVRRSQWDLERKSEFYLCGWLAAGLSIFLATLPIVDPQYFILMVPFLSILAPVGIMAIASWLHPMASLSWLVPAVLMLFGAGLPWWLWQQYHRLHWPQLEVVAKVVNDVTPEGGLVWADGFIYFAAGRVPPSGLENYDSLDLQLAPDDTAKLHIMRRADLYNWVAEGGFATVASCWATDDWIAASGLRKIYVEHAKSNRCDIFWSKASH